MLFAGNSRTCSGSNSTMFYKQMSPIASPFARKRVRRTISLYTVYDPFHSLVIHLRKLTWCNLVVIKKKKKRNFIPIRLSKSGSIYNSELKYLKTRGAQFDFEASFEMQSKIFNLL